MSSNKGRWEFRSAEDVSGFWDKYRTVPGRIDGRKRHHEERYCLGLYLLALADHDLLTYPLSVDEGESPDFMLSWPSAEVTGLEVTRATEPRLQRPITENEKAVRKLELEAFAAEKAPELTFASTALSAFGWADDQADSEWCSLFKAAIEKKLSKFSKFRPAHRYDLLVYDDTPVSPVHRKTILSEMRPYLERLQRENPKLGKTSFVVSLDLIFDVGGECRRFPYVEWSEVRSGDRDKLMTFAHRVEQAGQVAVKRAIRDHDAMGRAVRSRIAGDE